MGTSFFNGFLSNQNRISKEHPDYRRTYLINAILSVMIIFFLLFAILDFLVFKIYKPSVINFVAFLISSVTLYHFHQTNGVRFAARATVSILVIFILLVIFLIAPNNHIFYWMVTLPPVAFFLLGKRTGYIVSGLFGAIIATFYLIEYKNWNNEVFGLEGMSNVCLAYIGLVLSIAFFETSRQEAFDRMLMDIERRKLAEQTLKESQASLFELNATKDKFFSIIAHDLRSPFSSIVGFSEILQTQILSNKYERVEEFASYIKYSSQQAMDLLTNLLEWSRIQTGRIQLNSEYFELGILVHRIISLFNNTVIQKSITISTDFPNNLTVYADKDMIE
ncbi:MAG TPA: HAMP domain-containing sensor histidine kinase, partial [Prolixibacteraceae bacterium]|nr:HAMP domain-containing sensor histidine kinase [Prolixibacteraceae bacterium]